MHTDKSGLALNALTEKIIGCAYTVSNKLGAGFLEKVYENALAIELRNAGINFNQQASLDVFYDGVMIGEYACDLIVESKIIVELKSVKSLNNAHTAQCMNYLKATNHRLCLLINFGNPKVEIKRIILGF